MVFEAGAGCSGLDWELVQHALGDDVATLAHDRAGYGTSDPPGAASALDVLVALLDTVARGPVVLVGHSWGYHLVRLAAVARPELVRAVVLVDPRPERLAELHPEWDERTRASMRPMLAIGADAIRSVL